MLKNACSRSLIHLCCSKDLSDLAVTRRSFSEVPSQSANNKSLWGFANPLAWLHSFREVLLEGLAACCSCHFNLEISEWHHGCLVVGRLLSLASPPNAHGARDLPAGQCRSCRHLPALVGSCMIYCYQLPTEAGKLHDLLPMPASQWLCIT